MSRTAYVENQQPNHISFAKRYCWVIFTLAMVVFIVWMINQSYEESAQRQERHTQALERVNANAKAFMQADLPNIVAQSLDIEDKTVLLFDGKNATYLFNSDIYHPHERFVGYAKTYGRWNVYAQASSGHFYVITYLAKYRDYELEIERGKISRTTKDQVIKSAYDQGENPVLAALGVSFVK